MREYYEILNEVIEEIEKNLTSQIDYKKLAKIAGETEYALQRIFSFLTRNLTLTEYIRKRRLSKAAEELKKGAKVIEVAIKYQYDSPVSFARAFRKEYGISPKQMKAYDNIVLFPKIVFHTNAQEKQELKFRVACLEKQIFYGKSTGAISVLDNKSIATLWEECYKDGTLEYIKSTSTSFYYGASIYTETKNINASSQKDQMKYYILGKEPRKDFQRVVIPKAKWAFFKVDSKKQSDILNIIDQIFLEWLPSSGYKFAYPYHNLEIYYENDCEYVIPIE